LRLAQILERVGAEILIDLDNLQLGLADLTARAGGVGDELTALALQPRLVALELGIARNGNELLLVKFGDSNKLLPDQLELAFLCCQLRCNPRISSFS
jgi:hypothetical protein